MNSAQRRLRRFLGAHHQGLAPELERCLAVQYFSGQGDEYYSTQDICEQIRKIEYWYSCGGFDCEKDTFSSAYDRHCMHPEDVSLSQLGDGIPF
jgi:hypothetical protein